MDSNHVLIRIRTYIDSNPLIRIRTYMDSNPLIRIRTYMDSNPLIRIRTYMDSQIHFTVFTLTHIYITVVTTHPITLGH